MFTGKVAVYENLCRRVYALKFEIYRAVCGIIGLFNYFGVRAGAAVIIVSAVLSVVAVPGVRHVYGAFAAVFGIIKFPVFIEICYCFQR